MKTILLSSLALFTMTAQDWSQPVHVLHELKPCVTYRARVAGSYLLVEAAIEPGWHTFTMDNEKRSAEKLAGKPSLGVDQPTRFELTGGLAVGGPWMQPEPLDFSKPKLRWYSWGYEKTALFAAKVKQAGSGPTQIGIRGQACTDKTCKNIDVTLEVPATAVAAGEPAEIKSLIAVRE